MPLSPDFLLPLFHRLHTVWTWLWNWLIYVLPAMSNLILILVGIIMSLPKLAEDIENSPKSRKIFAAVCLVAGLVGFYFQVKRDRDTDIYAHALMEKVDKDLTNTNQELQTTNQLVSSLTVMVTDMVTINGRLSTLDVKIDAARGNPDLVHTLQNEIEAAQQQAQDAARRVQIATLQDLGNGMLTTAKYWYGAIDRIRTDAMEAGLHNQNQKERQSIRAAERQKDDDTDATYAFQIKPTVATVGHLVEELLASTPPTSRSDQDKQAADLFARSARGEVLHYYDLEFLAKYVLELVKQAR
jgi:DNA-binding protein YbaB